MTRRFSAFFSSAALVKLKEPVSTVVLSITITLAPPCGEKYTAT
jgi:hypothetical protein